MVFLVNLARVVFAPLVDPLQADLQVTEGTIGFVVTLAWLGSAVPRLPTGYLLTRVPRHYVVLATGGVLTVAATFTSFAHDPLPVMIGAFLLGLASGSYFIAANPLVSELFPDRVGRALGIHGMASQAAAVAASPLVIIALRVGTWRTTFRGMAIVAFVTTLAFAAVARRTALPAAGSEDRDMLAALRHQWRIVLTGIVIVGVTGFVWQGTFNFFVSYLQTRAYAPDFARLMLTVVFAAGIPAFLVGGWLADRVPIVSLLLAILGTFTASLFALTIHAGLLWLVVVSAVLGYAIHSLFPVVDTYLLGSLPDRHRASAYAIYSATMMIVQATGSWVVGLLRDAQVPFPWIYRSLALVLTVVLLGLVVSHRLGRLPSAARA